MGSPGSKTATGTIASKSTAKQLIFQGIAPCTIFAELRQEFAEGDRIHMRGVTQELPPAVYRQWKHFWTRIFELEPTTPFAGIATKGTL